MSTTFGFKPKEIGGCMSGTIRNLLAEKGRQVIGIRPEATIIEALGLMAEKNVGAVIVLSEDGELVGILSERDYARKIALKGRTSADTAVSEIMTSSVSTVSPDASVDDCMEMMTEGRFRHLPVVEDGRVVGVISIGDIVKAVIERQRALIGDLERYITS
jgi:CBS domain-containing protein